MSTRPTVRRLVGEDLASEQMLALMREAAGLPVVELRRIIAEELALMEVVGTGPQGAPTSVAAYVSRPDGVVLEYIAVAPELRGGGVGRVLVDALAGAPPLPMRAAVLILNGTCRGLRSTPRTYFSRR